MPEHDPIVYRYKPAHDGAGYPGVPQRHLRQSDVDALEGSALRDLTFAAEGGPYVAVKHAEPDKKAARTKAAHPAALDELAPVTPAPEPTPPASGDAPKGTE